MISSLPILSITIFLPLCGAFFAFFISGFNDEKKVEKVNQNIKLVSLWTSLMTFFVSCSEISHNSAEWQIKTYSSAAPSYIGDFATVIGGNGEILRQGTNGWTCQSANPRPFPEGGWSSAHDAMPACFDSEGAKWMSAFMAGEKPDMERDTYMWMLHGDVGEDNTTAGVLNKADSAPGQWIESGPHLMLMPKDPDSLKNFSDDFTTGAPYVMFPGTQGAHLMIPLEGYYKYQPESRPAK